MNIQTAIDNANLIQYCYSIPPTDLTNRAGTSINVAGKTYRVLATVYADDLATTINPTGNNNRVSFGLVVQDDENNLTIALRGTEGGREWLHDAEFLYSKSQFGNVDDGFLAMYLSLRTTPGTDSIGLAQALMFLTAPPVASITVTGGYSLGGADATLLALDIITNTYFKDVAVYTFGSPRVGDSAFAAAYNKAVPNTYRVANRVDVVPMLPLPPMYEHVNNLFELSSVNFLPPKVLVKLELGCLHHIGTYLYLLSSIGSGPVIPLSIDCHP